MIRLCVCGYAAMCIFICVGCDVTEFVLELLVWVLFG